MQTRVVAVAGLILASVVTLLQWSLRSRQDSAANKSLVAAQNQPAPRPVPRPAPASTPAPPVPMQSPEFLAALEGVLDIEISDAARLEQRLAARPDDFEARVKLMAYLARADRETVPGERAKRWKLAMWLVEQQPGSEILHSYLAQFSARDLPAESVQQAERLWEAAIRKQPGDARLLWNAACFFRDLSADLHLSYLEATADADPNHPHALRPLAQLYAGALLAGTTPLAARAERGLDRSKNVWVLGNAAYFLQSHYNQTITMYAPDTRAAQLAERYFLRAQAFDPSLDRKSILPQVDPGKPEQDRIAAERERTRFYEAGERIRRLGVDSFPQLPAGVARVLRSRGCTIPQPPAEAGGRGMENVIRGEFIEQGKLTWAVLCSVNQISTLLVFRNDLDTEPYEVSAGEDQNYMQGLGGDAIGYSRKITAVTGDFILRHYRAYGGEKPPPIDHHGIDDAFLGKASVTWYFYRGKWMPLQGAD